MSEKKQVLKALNAHVLLLKIEELGADLESFFVELDEELLDHEVAMECNVKQRKETRDELRRLELEAKKIEKSLKEKNKEKSSAKKSLAMMKDFMGLLQGKIFVSSAHGAVFFTSSMKEFAKHHKIRTSDLKREIKNSKDGFSLSIDSNNYCFLQSASEEYYFHLEEVEVKSLLSMLQPGSKA